jgi:anti-anti-sigma factor
MGGEMKPKERLKFSERDGVVVATFLCKNCLGKEAVADLGAELAGLAAGGQAGVILDCSRLEHLDSGSLKFIVRLHKALKRRGGGLAICRLPPTLREVFRITRLDDVVPVVDSVEAALPGLSARPAEAPPGCALCAWPRAAQCLLCGRGFCEGHGSVWGRLCRGHGWVVWVAALALVCGVVLVRALLKG